MARKVTDVTADRLGQLDHCPVAPDLFAEAASNVFECLPERGPGVGVRRFTPEKAGQLLSGMRTRLQKQEAEECQLLDPGLRDDRSPVRQ